jgi:hypothetical protein
VFGAAAPFVDATGEFAGVTIALEYHADEPSDQSYVPPVRRRDPLYDPKYHYDPAE